MTAEECYADDGLKSVAPPLTDGWHVGCLLACQHGWMDGWIAGWKKKQREATEITHSAHIECVLNESVGGGAAGERRFVWVPQKAFSIGILPHEILDECQVLLVVVVVVYVSFFLCCCVVISQRHPDSFDIFMSA